MTYFTDLPKYLKLKIIVMNDNVFDILMLNKSMARLLDDDVLWLTLIKQIWPKFNQDHMNYKILYKNHLLQIKKDYPSVIKDIFRQASIRMSSLPVLDIGDRMGRTQYIDFIQCREMSNKIMLFKDCYKRPGIVLRLKGISNKISEDHGDISKLKGTLAMFQRHEDSTNIWSFGWGGSNPSIECVYHEFENDTHIEHPFDGRDSFARVNKELIYKLLTDTEILFKLQ